MVHSNNQVINNVIRKEIILFGNKRLAMLSKMRIDLNR
jgi:hypothetical protein